MSKDEQQYRGWFVHVGDLTLDLPGARLPARRQARHFTTLDQVTQLVAAREADAERKGRLRRNTNAGTGRCRHAVSGKKEWNTSGYMLQVCKGSDRRGIR